MATRPAAVLSDEPKEEADGHAPAPLSVPGALSSPAQPGGWSVAEVSRPADRHRQKYDCRGVCGPAADAGAQSR